MRIVVTGASGKLGAYLVDHLEKTVDATVDAWFSRASSQPTGPTSVNWRAIDLTQSQDVANALDEADPEVVFHLAAISTADAVLADRSHASRVNIDSTAVLADWCERRERRLVFTSTDLVFDGTRPFSREIEEPHPILAYGITKHRAEQPVLETKRGLVARMSLLYGFSKASRVGFFDRSVAALERGISQTFYGDEFRTPLDYETAVAILAQLALSRETGVIHVAGRDRVSRWELMSRVARAFGIPQDLVMRNSLEDDLGLAEARPRDVSLDTTRLAEVCPESREATIERGIGLILRGAGRIIATGEADAAPPRS